MQSWYIRMDTLDEVRSVMTWLNLMGKYSDVVHAKFLRSMSIPYALGSERPARNQLRRHRYASVNTNRNAIDMLPVMGYPIHSSAAQVFAMSDLWSHKYDSGTHTWKNATYEIDFSVDELHWAKENLPLNDVGELWHFFVPA